MLYRQVTAAGEPDWRAAVERGLLPGLVRDGLLIATDDAALEMAATPDAVAVLRPRELRFVSYPYEWCFGQLREAALLTLELQKRALAVGMRLKDASAFNVQFDAGRPVLIDTLSFEVAPPTEPWPAYRQFCQHFLAPLALIAHRDPRCGLFLRDFIDGVPLDLAATLLPGRTRLNPGLGMHVHAHAGSLRRAAGASVQQSAAAKQRKVSALGQEALLDNLRRTVEGLRWTPDSHWVGYHHHTSYSEAGMASKRQIVADMLEVAGGKMIWDIGANTGTYSDLAAGPGKTVLAFDQDAPTVEEYWRALGVEARKGILPLVMDLANPSPALGWAHEERRSWLDRGPADTALALALVHHLAIGNNVPLPRVSALLARAARRVIVEFVPREDPMTQQLLAGRADIFGGYTLDAFRAALGADFTVLRETAVADSLRTLFLLERQTN